VKSARLCSALIHPVQLEGPVHAGRGQVGSVAAKPDPGGHGRVVVEHLEVVPLLAQVDPDVSSGNSQVGTALLSML
jgi:hypothetical protein